MNFICVFDYSFGVVAGCALGMMIYLRGGRDFVIKFFEKSPHASLTRESECKKLQTHGATFCFHCPSKSCAWV